MSLTSLNRKRSRSHSWSISPLGDPRGEPRHQDGINSMEIHVVKISLDFSWTTIAGESWRCGKSCGDPNSWNSKVWWRWLEWLGNSICNSLGPYLICVNNPSCLAPSESLVKNQPTHVVDQFLPGSTGITTWPDPESLKMNNGLWETSSRNLGELYGREPWSS